MQDPHGIRAPSGQFHQEVKLFEDNNRSDFLMDLLQIRQAFLNAGVYGRTACSEFASGFLKLGQLKLGFIVALLHVHIEKPFDKLRDIHIINLPLRVGNKRFPFCFKSLEKLRFEDFCQSFPISSGFARVRCMDEIRTSPYRGDRKSSKVTIFSSILRSIMRSRVMCKSI